MDGLIYEQRSTLYCVPFFIEQLDSVLPVKRFGYIGGTARANRDTLIELVIDFGITKAMPGKLYDVIVNFLRKHTSNPKIKLYVVGGVRGVNPARTRFEELQINMHVHWIWDGGENHPLDNGNKCGSYATLKEWFITNALDKFFGEVNIKDVNSLKLYLKDFDEMQKTCDYYMNAKSYRTTLDLDVKLSLY